MQKPEDIPRNKVITNIPSNISVKYIVDKEKTIANSSPSSFCTSLLLKSILFPHKTKVLFSTFLISLAFIPLGHLSLGLIIIITPFIFLFKKFSNNNDFD